MRVFVLTALAVVVTLSASVHAGIEAVKGKRYTLTKQHGPWMIMVASLRDRREWEGRTDGISAQEAADELVYYLRKRGIPAYTYSQKVLAPKVPIVDRRGRIVERHIFQQMGDISVIAGNYQSAETDVAQKTLDYIKKLDPPVLSDRQRGATYKKTKGQPKPLSGAFLTVNPLLTPEEARARRRDPVIARLNLGQQHSLLENKGKYTVVVASFYGKSVTLSGKSGSDPKVADFTAGEGLDQAGNDARMVASLLRKREIDAYVYHDRRRSIVTVGAFDTPQDPMITQIARKLGAKLKTHNGKSVLTAEAVTLPGPTPEAPPAKTWILDPSPQLIEVPKW